MIDHKKLIAGVLSCTPASVHHPERAAILTVLRAGEDHGYGNMIAWLATAWAAEMRSQGVKAEPKDFAGGRGYPLPEGFQ